MDRCGAGLLRSRENLIDQEIRILRRRRADANGLVGLAHMQRLGIRVAIDRDRAIAETLRAADHTDRDLATVGDQNLAESGHRLSRAFYLFAQPGLRFCMNAAMPSGASLPRTHCANFCAASSSRSEEHTSELQSLMRISY